MKREAKMDLVTDFIMDCYNNPTATVLAFAASMTCVFGYLALAIRSK